MENASKALLIAAAIIIAIILISLGVYVVRQGQSAMGSINLSEHEVSAFNSKWESYKGTQMGSSVKGLINQVNNYNRTANDGRKITVNTTDYETTPNNNIDFNENNNDTYTANQFAINVGSTYIISFGYTRGGLISTIGITTPTTH